MFRKIRRGAVTTDLFIEYYAHFCQWLRSEGNVSMDEEVVIIMGSGGGSMSHFATEIGVLSAKYRCRPFYLAPYHTAALMPLDQAPNREFERAWSECRSKQSNFSTLQALDACHECWDKAYSSQNVLKGFASVGMTLGKPLCREKVLLERGPHLFRKTVPKQERNYVSDCADKVLSPPKGYKRAPDSVRCSCNLDISSVPHAVQRMKLSTP